MIAFPCTLRQLRDDIDRMIEATGAEDTPVGNLFGDRGDDWGEWSGKGCELNEAIQLEYVWIDGNNVIVGDEANDYEKVARPGDRPAILIS